MTLEVQSSLPCILPQITTKEGTFVMTNRTKTLIIGLSGLMVVGGGAVAFAQSSPAPSPAIQLSTNTVMPHTKKHTHYKGLAVRVTAISGQTLTVTHGKNALSHTISLANAAIKAGPYSVLANTIKTGEHLRIVSWQGSHPQIFLVPVVHGTLQNTNGTWTVVGKKKTWTLTAVSTAQLVGFSTLTPGQSVTAYGVTSSTSLAPTVLAAPANRTLAQVTSAANGLITLTTKKWGTVSYTVPSPAPHWLDHLKVGQHVQAILNPQTHAVLALMPKHLAPWKKVADIARHNVVGTLTGSNTSALNLTTAWGQATVNIAAKTVTIVYPGHPTASLSQIPADAMVAVHVTAHKVHIRVMHDASTAN
ncbi:MAG: hypothetical protein C7B44_07355 [Sulfobacillus thermosulfidooxidans]|nr:MAG: hypothetical protein C7B44_07355 [Sulfobacillus thermosulfidooxidans]